VTSGVCCEYTQNSDRNSSLEAATSKTKKFGSEIEMETAEDIIQRRALKLEV
jgi:hypothetical protein